MQFHKLLLTFFLEKGSGEACQFFLFYVSEKLTMTKIKMAMTKIITTVTKTITDMTKNRNDNYKN